MSPAYRVLCPTRTTLSVGLLVALWLTVPAVACEHPAHGACPHGASPHGASPHGACPHGAAPHGECPHGASPHGTSPHGDHQPSGLPELPGQDAFGAIQEIVALLEADPETDWSRVEIDALRDHLVDMNRVTLDARVERRPVEGGVEYRVLGDDDATRGAIERMVPAHAAMMNGRDGIGSRVEPTDGGVVLTLTSDDPATVERLVALGFFGYMARGDHHRPHHLAMARGESPHRVGEGHDHGGHDHGGHDHGGHGDQHGGRR